MLATTTATIFDEPRTSVLAPISSTYPKESHALRTRSRNFLDAAPPDKTRETAACEVLANFATSRCVGCTRVEGAPSGSAEVAASRSFDDWSILKNPSCAKRHNSYR